MKNGKRLVYAIFILSLIIGCENEEKAVPVSPAKENVKPVEMPTGSPTSKPNEVKPIAGVPEQAVRIRLEPRGYLHAPIETIVADTPQTFAITFGEGMNRQSVEESLRKAITMSGDPSPQIDVVFNWQNERELNLTVSVKGLVTNPYPTHGYTVDLNGAVTSSGKTLRDTPTFQTYIQKPQQLWRISVEDGRMEKISKFNEPYQMQALNNADFMLATQFLDYCECDATLPLSHSVYNIGLNEMKTYPVPLMIQYKGKGDFVADTRGFFYEQPMNGVEIPRSDTELDIHVPGYVHGASFSLDRKNLILALGQEKQETDLDFVIYHLETKRIVNLPKKLIGQIPDNQVSSTKIPIQFQDDGRYVYTYMINEESHESQEFRYSWSSGMFEAWKSPVSEHGWSGFVASDDGTYRYYYNGNGVMYHENEKITLPADLQPRFWQKGTHRFVSFKNRDFNTNSTLSLYSYNVDDQKEAVIAKLSPGDYYLVGSSADGQWVYVSAGNDL
ncbi:hypothetical protein [Paenibacillus qinlingensis]|uniref:Lipoprotein n=1 Tax=Paenibacillus qinlingensis TaxID=1837343 RepID=A0ABU1NRB4_9BACL|nr:hypothetical protein [Paenibacillus qinlingensis]MDR6549958.1 hypothetical protein [Paenibacillus qinlingensis]